MKTFAIVLLVCVVGSYASAIDDLKVKLHAQKQECITETGVSDEALENAKNGIFDKTDVKLAGFAVCFLKKLGFTDADGKFNEANFRAASPSEIPKEKVDAIVEKCKNITGAALLKCYLENKTIPILD